MIAMRPVLSTSARALAALLVATLMLGACATHLVPAGPAIMQPRETADAFIMPDGTSLPYRTWLPDGEPWAVVLALHGMNDSRDAWEYPGPDFANAGIAIISPDQRGFGGTEDRGYWPGTNALVDDAREMVRLLRRRYPHSKLFLMGESMGAAVAMCLAASAESPPVDGYVLVSPAVWSRSEMNVILRASLWLAYNLVPGLTVTGRVAQVKASDNREAIKRLSEDPLTIHETRIDAVKGLVDLMDAAQAAAARLHARALLLYGGKDELIPDDAAASALHALPEGEVGAYYPDNYHLLLRDLHRATPIKDIVAWIRDPSAALPSGADVAAAAWLAKEK